MKSKYLDFRNCKALLPKAFDMAMLRGFENYLDELNLDSPHKGVIDKLIQYNQRTLNKKPWERLLSYDIDINLIIDSQIKRIKYNIQDYCAFPENKRTGANKNIKVLFSHIYSDGTRWTYKMPIQYLLKGWGDAASGYQCYVHSIKYSEANDENNKEFVEKSYTGITGRTWLQRLEEHLRKIRNGEGGLFHRSWRESLNYKGMIYTSQIIFVNLSFEEAMEYEQRYVDKWSLAPKGLNMIPGGFKGMKFLHQHRITNSDVIPLEEREKAISDYVRQNPRKGIPNPFMSEMWEDDDFYLRVIEAREKTLSREQVLQIRKLAAMGWSIPKISKEVNALNELQVKNVISGKTYKRIH